jgi:hypothetical protein
MLNLFITVSIIEYSELDAIAILLIFLLFKKLIILATHAFSTHLEFIKSFTIVTIFLLTSFFHKSFSFHGNKLYQYSTTSSTCNPVVFVVCSTVKFIQTFLKELISASCHKGSESIRSQSISKIIHSIFIF